MENQENQQGQNLPADDKWIDEILQTPPQDTIILPDEKAIAAAELAMTDNSDVDFPIDEILQTPLQNTEILPDEEAIAAAGLTHPAENEVDLLIQEALAHIQADADTALEPSMDATQVVAPHFKDEEYRDAFDEEEELEAIFNTDPYVEEEAILPEHSNGLPPELNQEDELPPAPPA